MKKVIVIGSGVAGLASALKLRELGAEVRVFEKDQSLGGRARSVREDEFIIDRGASFLMSGYRSTLDLVRKLGVESELQRIRIPARYDVLCNGSFFKVNYSSSLGLLPYRAVPLMQRLRLGRLIFPALKLRGPRSMEFLSTRGLEKVDDESLEQFVSRKLGKEVVEHFFEPMLTTYCGWAPEQVSKAYLALITRIGRMKLFCFRKGVGQLTEAMGKDVTVDCSADVTSVKETDHGVEVSVRAADRSQHAISADAAVIAVPGPAVANLWHSPPEPERTFLRQVAYAPAVLAHLCADRDWGYDNQHGFFFPRRSGRRTTGVALEHVRYTERAPAGRSILYTGPRLDQFPNLESASDEDVVDSCISDIEPQFPGLKENLIKSYVFRWKEAIPLVPLGSFRVLRDYLDSRGRGRIELAGDYIGGPCIEGAVASGTAAAGRVWETLLL